MRILLFPFATSSRMASRNTARESPEVILPARSTTEMPSDRRRDNFISISFPFLFPLRLGHAFNDGLQDRIGIDAFGLAFKIQNDAVTQGRQHHVADIAGCDFDPAIQQSPDFPTDDQSLRPPWARAIANEFLCQWMRHFSGRLRRPYDLHNVLLHGFRNRNRKDGLSKLQDLFGIPN